MINSATGRGEEQETALNNNEQGQDGSACSWLSHRPASAALASMLALLASAGFSLLVLVFPHIRKIKLFFLNVWLSKYFDKYGDL